MEFSVKNNKMGKRFEVQIDNSLAFVEYQIDGKQITLIHTEVPHELGGQGVGGKIAKVALDFARGNGLKVVSECSFVASYIERHQEYHDIVM